MILASRPCGVEMATWQEPIALQKKIRTACSFRDSGRGVSLTASCPSGWRHQTGTERAPSRLPCQGLRHKTRCSDRTGVTTSVMFCHAAQAHDAECSVPRHCHCNWMSISRGARGSVARESSFVLASAAIAQNASTTATFVPTNMSIATMPPFNKNTTVGLPKAWAYEIRGGGHSRHKPWCIAPP